MGSPARLRECTVALESKLLPTTTLIAAKMGAEAPEREGVGAPTIVSIKQTELRDSPFVRPFRLECTFDHEVTHKRRSRRLVLDVISQYISLTTVDLI